MIEANGKPIILLPLEQPLGTVESVLACPPPTIYCLTGVSLLLCDFLRVSAHWGSSGAVAKQLNSRL